MCHMTIELIFGVWEFYCLSWYMGMHLFREKTTRLSWIILRIIRKSNSKGLWEGTCRTWLRGFCRGTLCRGLVWSRFFTISGCRSFIVGLGLILMMLCLSKIRILFIRILKGIWAKRRILKTIRREGKKVRIIINTSIIKIPRVVGLLRIRI